MLKSMPPPCPFPTYFCCFLCCTGEASKLLLPDPAKFCGGWVQLGTVRVAAAAIGGLLYPAQFLGADTGRGKPPTHYNCPVTVQVEPSLYTAWLEWPEVPL